MLHEGTDAVSRRMSMSWIGKPLAGTRAPAQGFETDVSDRAGGAA